MSAQDANRGGIELILSTRGGRVTGGLELCPLGGRTEYPEGCSSDRHHQPHGLRDSNRTGARKLTHRFQTFQGLSRSQSEACAGCTVSSTTRIMSPLSFSRSVSSRQATPKAASTCCALYFRRENVRAMTS